MRLADEVAHGLAQPVIAPRETRGVAHALLHDAPGAGVGEEEAVMIKLKPVLHGGAVDFGAHLRGENEAVAFVDRSAVGDGSDLARRLAAGAAFAAGDVDAEVVLEVLVGFLHRAAGDGGDAGGVPVEAEDAAESLEPPRVAE